MTRKGTPTSTTSDYTREEQHLKAYQSLLKPSVAFRAQTKAKVFQRIAEDNKSLTKLGGAFRRWVGIVTSGVVLAGALFSSMLLTPQVSLAHVGEFDAVEGQVYVRRGDSLVQVRSKDKIFEGDTIEVASASKAEIRLAGEARAELSENTRIHVDTVVTMRLENDDLVTSQVNLALEKGTYVQKKTEDNDSPTVITLATPSGTIKASTSADYIVDANDTSKIALSVHSSGVTVTRDTDLVASGKVVAEGESLLLSEDAPIVVRSEVVTATGAVIATTEKKPDVQVKSTVVRPTVQTLSVDEEPEIVVPETTSLPLIAAVTLNSMQKRLEIAEVKMQQVITHYTSGERPEAQQALKGYVSTVNDVYHMLTEQDVVQKNTSTLDDIVAQSTLMDTYNELKESENIDRSSPIYRRTMQALETLSKAEAALRMDIADAQAPVIAMQESSTGSRMTITTDAAPAASFSADMIAVDAPQEEMQVPSVKSYAKSVQTSMIDQVSSILANTDAKQRSTDFVALLGRIPNETRNIPLLERIQSMAPQNLKGFVEVKLHQIRYPEVR